MLQLDLDFLGAAGGDGDRRQRFTVNADLELGDAGRIFRACIIHPQLEGHGFPDDGEARGVLDGQGAVDFVVGPGEQRVEGRARGRQRARGQIVDLPVGDGDNARDALRRHIGNGVLDGGEQARAAGSAA